METLASIKKRVSVRKYKDKPIPKDCLEKMVDSGRRAPTARAVEPWEFIVITTKDTLKNLGRMTKPSGIFLADAGACIAVFCKDTKYYLEDGSAAAENILLAAVDFGLGACWVAGDKKPYAGEVSKLLGVPPGFNLVSLISLGWPEAEKEQKRERSLKDVIHWEKF